MSIRRFYAQNELTKAHTLKSFLDSTIKTILPEISKHISDFFNGFAVWVDHLAVWNNDFLSWKMTWLQMLSSKQESILSNLRLWVVLICL